MIQGEDPLSIRHSRGEKALMIFLLVLLGILLWFLSTKSVSGGSAADDTQVQDITDYPLYDTLTPQEKINLWSFRYGICPKMAKRIAWAESGFKNICNRESCGYGQGQFQFIPTTWKYVLSKMVKSGEITQEEADNADPLDENINIQAGCYLLSTEGVRHWVQSAHNHGYYAN